MMVSSQLIHDERMYFLSSDEEGYLSPEEKGRKSGQCHHDQGLISFGPLEGKCLCPQHTATCQNDCLERILSNQLLWTPDALRRKKNPHLTRDKFTYCNVTRMHM